MKPEPQSEFIDVWFLIRLKFDQMALNNLQFETPLGTSCMYLTLQEAQHQQTVEALKGIHYHIFHLEFPRNNYLHGHQ